MPRSTKSIVGSRTFRGDLLACHQMLGLPLNALFDAALSDRQTGLKQKQNCPMGTSVALHQSSRWTVFITEIFKDIFDVQWMDPGLGTLAWRSTAVERSTRRREWNHRSTRTSAVRGQ